MQEPSNNERVVVFGGSGFLGARLLRALSGGRAHILSVSRRPQAGPPTPDAVEPAVLDLAADPVAPFLDDARPTAVLSVAALSRGADCEREPDLAEQLNVDAPRRIAEWCASHGVRCVHVSTDLVFDGEPPEPAGYRESDAPRPLHVYGRTKALGERAVLAADPAALVVRLPLLFGASEGRGLGASDSLLGAVATEREVALFVDEWRTPLDVDDAARALVECAATRERGILHVGGGERLTRHELGLAVLETLGVPRERVMRLVRGVRRADLGLEPPRPRDVSLNSALAGATLRWRARSVGQALKAEPKPDRLA